ncbi:MAG TPA: hypothetical protein VH079_13695 [Terriglobales bacterium]|nr:hypothetical protein [Terriglobales bacterium]
MNWRVIGFFIALMILCGEAFFVLRRRKRAPIEPSPQQWSWRSLVVASFLTLFAELVLIRWLGTEVRVFAYVKNLALLLCFLGFGLGCALSKYPVRWISSASALLGLVMLVRLPWHSQKLLEGLSQALGAGQDIQIWSTGTVRNWPDFLSSAFLTALLLFLITCIFVPLGQTVSRQLEIAASPLRGYSWNLAASIVGIAAVFAVSWNMLPPTFWFGIVLCGIAFLQPNSRRRFWSLGLIVPIALLLHESSTPRHFSTWTPYQQIEFQQENFPDGEFERAIINVNHTGYQYLVNLSPEFLARHPNLLNKPPDENPYNLPFRFASPRPKVLIVGSGAGNDVAAAVRNQSQSVDAVEIDPAILALGERHPEHPYHSSVVTAHLTDARAFMKRATGPYDLILFGLLDSHTQLSDYSNMRIDSFVYTEESFREAAALLAPNGVLFIKFQVTRPWLGLRLEEMLRRVFGKEPVVFQADSTYATGGACFVISRSGQVEDQLARDPRLLQFVTRNHPVFADGHAVPETTDDWPYLYQEGRWLPGIFVSISGLVVLLGGVLYWRIPEARQRVPSLFFFSMGAGFLLLETQIISRLALYFGTTWQVNGIVIGAILTALLLANAIIEKQGKPWPSWVTVGGLIAGIAIAYAMPFSRIPGSAALVGWIAAAVFSVPVFFAGVLFATQFRQAESPGAALGANMLGAVIGGLLENLSLLIGLKALLLVALGLYLLAAWSLTGIANGSSWKQHWLKT